MTVLGGDSWHAVAEDAALRYQVLQEEAGSKMQREAML